MNISSVSFKKLLQEYENNLTILEENERKIKNDIATYKKMIPLLQNIVNIEELHNAQSVSLTKEVEYQTDIVKPIHNVDNPGVSCVACTTTMSILETRDFGDNLRICKSCSTYCDNCDLVLNKASLTQPLATCMVCDKNNVNLCTNCYGNVGLIKCGECILVADGNRQNVFCSTCYDKYYKWRNDKEEYACDDCIHNLGDQRFRVNPPNQQPITEEGYCDGCEKKSSMRFKCPTCSDKCCNHCYDKGQCGRCGEQVLPIYGDGYDEFSTCDCSECHSYSVCNDSEDDISDYSSEED